MNICVYVTENMRRNGFQIYIYIYMCMNILVF